MFLFVLMQPIFSFSQAADLVSIRERLGVRFGKIRVEDRPGPVDQFVGSFIGSHTYDWKFWNAFAQLVRRHPSWDAVTGIPIADTVKTPELKRALRAIRACFSQINFDFLKHCSVNQALSFIGK